MADRKDFLTSGGNVNEDMFNAITVLVAGLGVRNNGTDVENKISAVAARNISANYAIRVMEQEKKDKGRYLKELEKERNAFAQMLSKNPKK